MQHSIHLAIRADTPEQAVQIAHQVVSAHPTLLHQVSIDNNRVIKLTPTVRTQFMQRFPDTEQSISLTLAGIRNALKRSDLNEAHPHILPLLIRFLLFYHEFPTPDIPVYNLQDFSYNLPSPSLLKHQTWQLVPIRYSFSATMISDLLALIEQSELQPDTIGSPYLAVGGKVLEELGSSRHALQKDYLIHSTLLAPGLVRYNPRLWFLNAWGDPFLEALWQTLPDPLPESAPLPVIYACLLYTYLQLQGAADHSLREEVAFDIKWVVRKLNSNAVPELVETWMTKEERKIISSFLRSIRGFA